MELHNIDILLRKYLEGKTSLKEEKQLRAYFTSGNVASHHKEYRVLFGFFKAERKLAYEPRSKTNRKTRAYPWFGVAAGIAIIMGIFLFGPNPQEKPGGIKDPEIALQKTKEALHLIAQQMNRGKEELVYLTAIDNTRDELIEQNLKLKK